MLSSTYFQTDQQEKGKYGESMQMLKTCDCRKNVRNFVNLFFQFIYN